MPRIAKNNPSSRLNLELDDTVRADIEWLRDRTREDSLGAVIRRAVAIYKFIELERQVGNVVVVRDCLGKEREIVFL